MRIIKAFLVLALWTACAPHKPAAPTSTSAASDAAERQGDPVLGMRISQGIAFDGRLWLRGGLRTFADNSGGLVSFNLPELTSRRVHFERGTFAMYRRGRELWVLRHLSDDPRRLVVSTWDGQSFTDSVEFRREKDDEPVALVAKSDRPLVLSTKAVRTLERENGRDSWKSETLRKPLEFGVQVAGAPLNGQLVYVGFNRGEFGGALQRVELDFLGVANVDSRKNNELCAGPFNPDCDPVTGVIAHPTEPDCVLASVGLIHMFSAAGRIIKVCGTTVTVEFERKFAPDPKRPDLLMTTPVFGLQSGGEGTYWAYSHNTLFRFRGATHEEFPLPKPDYVGGLCISRALPGAILVVTDINWAVSVSGYTPLVVPLEGR